MQNHDHSGEPGESFPSTENWLEAIKTLLRESEVNGIRSIKDVIDCHDPQTVLNFCCGQIAFEALQIQRAAIEVNQENEDELLIALGLLLLVGHRFQSNFDQLAKLLLERFPDGRITATYQRMLTLDFVGLTQPDSGAGQRL